MNQKASRIAAVLLALGGAQFLVPAADAATRNATDCSVGAVQNAVNGAASGDTVLVPPGNCAWSAALLVSKAITLRGAGATDAGTKITYQGTGHTLVDVEGPSSKGRVDISGFWFVGGDANFWNGTVMQLHGPVAWNNLRVHDNVFQDNQNWTIIAVTSTHGLIDNNTFRGHGFGIQTYGAGAADWASTLELGTGDFLFIEANTFDYDDFYGNTGVPAVDMDDGGRVVFRHNSLRYAFFETHDKARSGLASANAYEVYENSFWTDTNKWKGIDATAGTGVLWGNTFTGDYTHIIGLMDYKSFDPRAVSLCDGTDPADQNVPGESGWRCQYQIGSMGEGPTAYGYPLYIWNNTDDATLRGAECTAGCQHIQSGRDYIDNGTDAKPGYTPFSFPHPLASGAPQPQPPTALSVQ